MSSIKMKFDKMILLGRCDKLRTSIINAQPGWDRVIVCVPPSELPSVDTMDYKQRTLIIFEGLSCSSQLDKERLDEYTIRGRLRGVTILYIAEDWTTLPKVVRKLAYYVFVSRNLDLDTWKSIKCTQWIDKLPQTLHDECSQALLNYGYFFVNPDPDPVWPMFEFPQ